MILTHHLQWEKERGVFLVKINKEKSLTKNPNLNDNEHLRFITCGSVDDGKSTLIGRLLLWEANLVYEDQLKALDKDSEKFGSQGKKIDLALLVDGLAAEREQGITIDVAYRYFNTKKKIYLSLILLDMINTLEIW